MKKSGIEADTISLFQKNIRIRKLVVPEQGVEKWRERELFNPNSGEIRLYPRFLER